MELPAAFAATAIASIAVPATSTTSPTTTPTSTTAESAAATPTTAASTFPRRPGFIHDNFAAHEIMAVQPLDGALGFFVAIDFDEPEPAWLSRKTVAHQRDIRRGDSRLRK
jgi:hypothetical protein